MTRARNDDTAGEGGQLAIEAATALLMALPWVQRDADAAARTAGALSASRVRMLMVLTEGSCRGSEIAAHWQITRAAVTTSAATLEREGYLRRVPDPDDGRAVRFALTAKGRQAMERFGRATTRSLARHLATLPAARQEALRDAARALRESLVGRSAAASRRVP